MFRLPIANDLYLRLLEERHSEELFRLIDGSRQHLRQWLPWLDGVTALEDVREYVRTCLQQFASNNGLVAGIWYQGRLAGTIGHHSIDWHNLSAAIGYWLGEAFQGKGIMTRACRALVDYSFDELGLNRIEVHCATGNARSRAIPERLGFKEEGVIRQAEWLYDRFVDHVVYGMLASEWRAARADGRG